MHSFLPSPFDATRNFYSSGFTGAVTLLFQLCCFNFVVSLATVGWFEKIPQDGNRTNVHTQAWCVGMFRARFAVFVRRARVLPNPCYCYATLVIFVL